MHLLELADADLRINLGGVELRMAQKLLDVADTAAKNIEDKTKKLDRESRVLASITERLEERDQRSKWDWATLGCAMLVSAELASGGAFYLTKANIEQGSFSQAVSRIPQDTDAGCCDIADGQIINSQSNAKFCAIHMPNYVGPKPAAE